MFLVFRPWLFWLAAPVVIMVGTLAGVASAHVEQSGIQPTPQPGSPGAILLQLPSVVSGRVLRFDLPAAAIIVQRRDGKTVRVFLKANTVLKYGLIRVRPRDLQVDDIIIVVGRPVANQGVNATLITIMPRRGRLPPAAGA
jgi:hypothetical protein